MSRVVIYDKGIRNLFFNSRGPVAKIIDHKARLIERNAHANIQRKFDSRTGDLLASLRKVPKTDLTAGYSVAVGADAQHRGFNYARALETGKNPDTGADMRFTNVEPGYMIPAVRSAGFRQRA